ncbi:tRNA preQ1(34) S-adenosylmethionine ribosyltransferase-isomerase QueA [Desulfobulbus oligotrophicus]|uniref:S-adenosylmethionine:tRNA ribosyltransferase-isomerase n=1 Tax=Desulfobulbus oligotrophicus TaxID=1909699 RepID=A0A7T5VCY1_9BACT|nr:tRNA preQ1(34) S-adenosylmethionine ribosyltransferase-isomerase QueA [Desulfobulbus oligotrophicus]QQG65578.1 tRNA preQ1(34) S-adenosylmethionine ribosyltransferase-isomerase QueA [Desulfobulbus oligotrophicus]
MPKLSYQLSDYDYDLPADQIAQFPAPQRDRSRLLILDLNTQAIGHRIFTDISTFFRPGDVLVVNTTKVFPARLLGHKETGGRAELFLLSFPHSISSSTGGQWSEAVAPALIKSAKRPKIGSLIFFSEQLQARINTLHPDGKAEVTLQFHLQNTQSLEQLLEHHGQIPLPPYINRPTGHLAADQDRYQTRYAYQTGSVAAPTAGLHFTDQLLTQIQSKGVEIADILLHVGYGTFAPIRTSDIRKHSIHKEWYTVSPETAAVIQRAKNQNRRIWAVGTTTVRTLEFITDPHGNIQPGTGECDLYIYPGFRFRTVDNLITNFHLPKSSLLLLVSALAGRQRILEAYQQAADSGYRFFSYGDAMAIISKP